MELERELDVWDVQLAQHGEQLDGLRRKHVESARMAEITGEVIRNVLNEDVTWDYWGGWERDQSLFAAVVARRSRDRQVGFTSVGPHRADIIWKGTAGNGP